MRPLRNTKPTRKVKPKVRVPEYVPPEEAVPAGEEVYFGLQGELAKFLSERDMFHIMIKNHGVLYVRNPDSDPMYLQVFVRFLRYRMAYFKVVDWTSDSGDEVARDIHLKFEDSVRDLSEHVAYDTTARVIRLLDGREIPLDRFDNVYVPAHEVCIFKAIFEKPLDEICYKGYHYRKVLLVDNYGNPHEIEKYPCHVYHFGVKARLAIIPTLFGYIAYRYVTFGEAHIVRPEYVAETPLAIDSLYIPLEAELPYYIYHLMIGNAVKRTKAWKRYLKKIGRTYVKIKTPHTELAQVCTVYRCRECGLYLLGYAHALHHLATRHNVVSEIVRKVMENRKARQEVVDDTPEEEGFLAPTAPPEERYE